GTLVGGGSLPWLHWLALARYLGFPLSILRTGGIEGSQIERWPGLPLGGGVSRKFVSLEGDTRWAIAKHLRRRTVVSIRDRGDLNPFPIANSAEKYL
ncbi:hypothetical protein, partial [Trichothermofontia sp.]